MNELKTALILYTHNFTFYDYIAYGWLFLTFLIFVIFSILISKKSSVLSFLSFLLSLILILAGPFILKYILDKNIRTVKIEHINIQKLHFSDTLIIDFTIKNNSKVNFKECFVKLKIYKPSKNKYKNLLNQLKPIKFKPILYNDTIKTDSSVEKRVVLDNFRYGKDINVSIDANCY